MIPGTMLFHASWRAVLRGGSPRFEGVITISEILTKSAFQDLLRTLLPNAAAGAEEIWADFARECVQAGQYVDFVPEPEETALGRWYDTLLASFVLLKQDCGGDVAASICGMSLDDRCLYPYEMERAGLELKEGGNVDALFQLMMEGTLEAPVPVFPKLRDTAPQMLLENRLESMSQI